MTICSDKEFINEAILELINPNCSLSYKELLINEIKLRLNKIQKSAQHMENRLRLYRKTFENTGKKLGFEIKRVKK